jgi:transcriptional regulator with XRE-family HTH domain
MKTEQAEFGKRLRHALRNAGLGEGATQLADLVSAHGGDAVTVQAAHNWIHGKTMPRHANLKALARGLGIRPEQLYDDTPTSLAGKTGHISARDQRTINAFLSLPPKGRDAVGSLVVGLMRMVRG